MRSPILAILALATLGACAAQASGVSRPSGEVAVITYSTGPCFGTCPVYSVEVRSDGTGTFTGERFTAVTGARDFTLAPGAFAAFSARLAAFRPEGEERISHGHPRCGMAATDMPSAEVRWRDAEGPDSLYYYYGCRDEENAALREALGEAPSLLPIADMIGPRQRL